MHQISPTLKRDLQKITVVTGASEGIGRGIERTQAEAPDYAGAWAPLTPLRRIGQASDVAAAVVFLASPQAEFITGQTIYVDGGLLSQIPWPYPVERGKV